MEDDDLILDVADDSIVDISIDCETLGVSTNNPAIVSVGWVAFKRYSGEVQETGYYEVDLDNAIKHGHVDGSTLQWWMRMARGDDKEREASTVLDESIHDLPLSAVLGHLSEFIDRNRHHSGGIWLNGPCEDGAWLKSAYNSTDKRLPWNHWELRDLRTLVVATELAVPASADQVVRHNALDDALWQAKVVTAAFNKLLK